MHLHVTVLTLQPEDGAQPVRVIAPESDIGEPRGDHGGVVMWEPPVAGFNPWTGRPEEGLQDRLNTCSPVSCTKFV